MQKEEKSKKSNGQISSFEVYRPRSLRKEDELTSTPPFISVLPASKQEEINKLASFFTSYAWDEIAKRRRGLPMDWVCEINLKNLRDAGFISFSGQERDGKFIVRVSMNTGNAFTLLLYKDDENLYQGEIGLLRAYIICSITDMVCYSQELSAPQSSGGNTVTRKVVKRDMMGKAKRYFPLKKARSFGTSSGNRKLEKASFINWFLRQSPSASPEAMRNALVIAGIVAIPDGYTFVRPFWRGVGERVEKQAVTTYLCESFIMTINKLFGSSVGKVTD